MRWYTFECMFYFCQLNLQNSIKNHKYSELHISLSQLNFGFRSISLGSIDYRVMISCGGHCEYPCSERICRI